MLVDRGQHAVVGELEDVVAVDHGRELEQRVAVAHPQLPEGRAHAVGRGEEAGVVLGVAVDRPGEAVGAARRAGRRRLRRRSGRGGGRCCRCGCARRGSRRARRRRAGRRAPRAARRSALGAWEAGAGRRRLTACAASLRQAASLPEARPACARRCRAPAGAAAERLRAGLCAAGRLPCAGARRPRGASCARAARARAEREQPEAGERSGGSVSPATSAITSWLPFSDQFHSR